MVFFSVGVLFTLIVVLKIKRPCSDDWFQSDGRYWRGYDEAEVSRRRRRRRAGGGEVEGAEGEGGDGGGESREENEESEWEGDEEGADSMGYINIMMAPLSRTEQWAKPGW